MTNEITSANNSRVKQWAQLLSKKGRDEQNKYVIEGTHLVQEALHSDEPVETILYSLDRELPTELQEWHGAGSTEWIAVTEAVLSKVTDTRTPQGIAAIVSKKELGAEPLLSQPDGLVVVVDGIQDPGNLGTIIRVADAAGATGVVLGRGTVDLYNPKTVRATMGSLFHLPVVHAELVPFLRAAGEQGIQLLNTSLDAQESCYETDFKQATWIIVGNEGAGVSDEVSRLANRNVLIPMRGRAESLNVAMATTVLLYEALRQRSC
ncbi:RNA methyltransferase [Paenibacillus sp. J2TS4]|uniref:TrmH family RNA methyltransferase n=1 Tax=Paenibacillus sp. J2TS4 TaxID=2807194 RepID=UPI001B1922AD|nr:RNA methyltransferase [Paenibacillus sp. J2TS4]GIP31092.1 23S rRNA methyltransferase [Paenibacillus sp. J2TS4]